MNYADLARRYNACRQWGYRSEVPVASLVSRWRPLRCHMRYADSQCIHRLAAAPFHRCRPDTVPPNDLALTGGGDEVEARRCRAPCQAMPKTLFGQDFDE